MTIVIKDDGSEITIGTLVRNVGENELLCRVGFIGRVEKFEVMGSKLNAYVRRQGGDNRVEIFRTEHLKVVE